MKNKNLTIAELKRLVEEAIVNIKGGRGYSAGKPFKKHIYKPLYGKSEYDIDDSDLHKSHNDLGPVDISRAFKEEENVW